MGSGPGSLRIPAFVDDSISAMRQMGDILAVCCADLDMSIEGVFRKNGNIRKLKEISDAFDKQPQPPSLDEEHPVQIAALLKKFLRELPDPLLTCKLQKLWLCSQSTLIRFLPLICRNRRSRFPKESPPSNLLPPPKMQPRYNGSSLFVPLLGGLLRPRRRRKRQ